MNNLPHHCRFVGQFWSGKISLDTGNPSWCFTGGRRTTEEGFFWTAVSGGGTYRCLFNSVITRSLRIRWDEIFFRLVGQWHTVCQQLGVSLIPFRTNVTTSACFKSKPVTYDSLSYAWWWPWTIWLQRRVHGHRECFSIGDISLRKAKSYPKALPQSLLFPSNLGTQVNCTRSPVGKYEDQLGNDCPYWTKRPTYWHWGYISTLVLKSLNRAIQTLCQQKWSCRIQIKSVRIISTTTIQPTYQED